MPDEFEELHAEAVRGYPRALTAQDYAFLRAAIGGHAFEPETLDQMRYMRLYYMNLVAIYHPDPDEWPVAIITMIGSQVVEAVMALTPGEES